MNLFIAGLPDDLDNQELKELFEEFGKVISAYVVYEKGTNKSRCIGFVTMPNEKEAQQAINELHGSGLDDNTLTVMVARERNPNKSNRGRRV
ncbi:RNA recognition motif domain-containing protein [Foetidibacter luteolus]|uniref:RNA recognition motif domain-containing protein n=1 Tax=Foetidibacter luteolus TaxID=2608880 RepID=UPI00129AE752|nr:RNA-binding protein [Foetidibacter luteolus]